MIWFVVMQIFSTLLEWVMLGRRSESEKDLEILLLRRQLAILERKLNKPRRPSRGEKLSLVVIAYKLKAKSGRTIKQLSELICIVKPATVFKWHQELVRRKWTYNQQCHGGRPPANQEIEQLVVRLARENDWGKKRIASELLKLGHHISHATVANIWRRHGIPPAPQRDTSPSWRHLMTHDSDQLLACDSFTIETLFLRTLYVLVFIELGSRRVYFAGCTDHPSASWLTQQARPVLWNLEEQGGDVRFLIHDNDKKFTHTFDTMFRSEGMTVIYTP